MFINSYSNANYINDNNFKIDDNLGYIYILENEYRVKIGRTSRPGHRVQELNNSNSGGLQLKRMTVIGPMYIDKTIESLLHEKFKANRDNGEWFVNISYEDIVNKAIDICTSDEFIKCNNVRKLFIENNNLNSPNIIGENKIC